MYDIAENGVSRTLGIAAFKSPQKRRHTRLWIVPELGGDVILVCPEAPEGTCRRFRWG